MDDMEYQIKTEDLMTGKTIKDIEVTGWGVWLKTTDGIVLDYKSSGHGYSYWAVESEEELEEGEE